MSQRHYKDKQKCTETLQRQTQMSRDITKTNKNVCHYKDKQKCTETLSNKNVRVSTQMCLTLQRQTKMYRDTTKTNCTETLQRLCTCLFVKQMSETLQRQTKM